MYRSSTAQSPVRGQMPSRSLAEKALLHPVLQNALANLDITLEAELLRYRRQRALGKATYTPRSLSPRQVRAALEQMPVGSPPAPLPETSTPSAFHPTASVPPLVAIAPTATPAPETTFEDAALELQALAKQYASEVAASSDGSVSGSPDDYLESSEELLRTLSQEQAQVEAEQGFMQSLLTPLGMGSMLLLLMSSALFGFVIMNPASVTQLLDRSGAIAHNTIAPTATPSDTPANLKPQPDLSSQEFPELSLGNLGAIPPEPGGVQGVPQAPAIAQPKSPQINLGTSGLVRIAPSPAIPIVPKAPQVNTPNPDPAPPRVDVPSPRKLAPAPSYEPPARAYVPPARSYSPPPARAYTPPAQSYRSPPIQPYTPPSQATAPVPKPNPSPAGDRTPMPPAPGATVTPAPAIANSPTYKVVTPYTSDRTLEEYRGKVPDAYVKNYSDGAKVQFGAYQDESSAKAQAEELRKQGIPADVYKP